MASAVKAASQLGRCALPVPGWRAVALAHAHAAEPDRRDLQAAGPKPALLHRASFCCGQRSWYSSSVTCSPQSASGRSSPGTASVMDRCVMKWSGAAPCQCHWSGGVETMSPARISSTAPPRDCTSPLPSMTYRVWPTAWACQAVRADGVNRTALTRTREGSSPRTIGSIQTSPVNHSAGPLAVGCLGWMGTGGSLLRCRGRRRRRALRPAGGEELADLTADVVAAGHGPELT